MPRKIAGQHSASGVRIPTSVLDMLRKDPLGPPVIGPAHGIIMISDVVWEQLRNNPSLPNILEKNGLKLGIISE